MCVGLSEIRMSSKDEEALVRYISFVRREGGEPMLGIPYREMSVDPDLVASFVLAIIIFENRQLKTFTKEGYVVIIEEGAHTVGLLIVDKVENDEPYRNNLRVLIERFEEEFEATLGNWKGDIRPFRAFALEILGVYPYRDINCEMVPKLIGESGANPEEHAAIPWSVGATDIKIQTIVGFINGKRTVREIMEASGFSEADTKAIFSMLSRYKWIRFARKLGPDSVLKRVTEPPKSLIGAYGEQFANLVGMFDGLRTFKDVCSSLSIDMDIVTTLTKNLLDLGVLGYSDED
jgi:hypothetical protein